VVTVAPGKPGMQTRNQLTEHYY